MVTQEGTRPLLVEIQALVDERTRPIRAGSPWGWSRTGSRCCSRCCTAMPASPRFDQDVFVNAVGGVRIDEPGADLAVTAGDRLVSLRNRPLPAKLVVFGEVGLAGEVRPVQRGQERLREAAKLGFTHAIIPRANQPQTPIEGIEVIAVDRVEEAVD